MLWEFGAGKDHGCWGARGIFIEKVSHEPGLSGSFYFHQKVEGWGLGEAGIDAVEQYGNWFGILFCYTWLNPKVRKPLSYATVLRGFPGKGTLR